MKKVGGLTLMIIGAAIIVLAAIRAINVLLTLIGESGEQTAYGTGFIAGAVFMAILLSLIGVKLIKKGRVLFNSQSITSE